MIDPTGMAASYNWSTGQYEDGGKVISWEDVQSQYEIGDYSPAVTVMLFPTFGQKDSPTDWGHAVQDMFEEAKGIKGEQVRVLQVKNIDDAVNQILGVNSAIDNLFIGSHGVGKDGSKAFFKIGGTTINNETFNLFTSEFRDIASKLTKDAEVILAACGAGMKENGGTTLISRLSNALNATVYGNQSWTMSGEDLFDNNVFHIRYYPVADGIPINHKSSAGNFKNALAHEGIWSKATPDGAVIDINNVYFNSEGRIQYDTP